MMTVLPIADTTTPASKKRRRSIEPVDSSKILAMPLSMSPRSMASSPVRAALQQTAAVKHASRSEDLLRRSLMGLSLQLKLKMILVEAWASDMNSVVMERNLFSIAKELAVLKEMGVYEQHTCVRFLELARNRMAQLLEQTERHETLHMEAEQMWTMALIQAQEAVATPPTSPSAVSEFPLLSGFDASSRDISVLWRAMSIARDRGAQLWHENKPEQALPFLLAADSYMKRFTLKYQRLKVDHAMVDTLQKPSVQPKRTPSRVSFAEEPQVMGIADAEVDRTPICPTKPSKLESLLLRTSREFPTPPF
ncbi:uncharacterized protein PITG_01819 [Phytophthora infestans T30-4]|uniref:Uncharacterized protein n=3 Tax=Phytophthora infestans TaxID=4787 RepID=D0MU61_PHYIT|nr:uncharacterized protein PITG_01819 [Phytophthora infestans T30-4]EEY61508.1 conserved hypothetical protein [Phytophthora infestans T30-4]KAF4036457.1 hypothetical protein GN244_ATG11567 [Phytophthora infestans]KAF4138979.1 hypothetical protein GN958_ATG11936 [Phytophthora infestans]KAI9993724.1 hypothetical protein PInf_016243 [Phytophthora infestans]|eukprot:XP_002908425.1 conserved hypothetical protein [Phytophthora infestans T30-4]